MQDQIYDVLIPTEDEIEVKDGKRRTVEKRVFPGYVMVQMRWDPDEGRNWTRTPGIPCAIRPVWSALSAAKISRRRCVQKKSSASWTAWIPKTRWSRSTYKIGERVRIVGGPFNDFPGTVATIDSGREKVRVMVDFFGRETAVVLSFMEVERM